MGDYTRYFIKDVNGYRLYQLPQTEIDWYTWECDMCDRDSEHDLILFKDGDTYWSLDWFSFPLIIGNLVDFFVNKTIDETELLEKHMGPTMAGQQVELGPCPLVAQYDQA